MNQKQNLLAIKFCSQCGREIPEGSQAHHCPHCGGPLTQICQVKPTIKRIFFIKPLIDKLRSENPPKCTYRTQKKMGVFKVFSGNWRVGTSQQDEGIIIAFYGREEIETDKLTDKDAQLAGVNSGEELRKLFKKFYGRLPAKMWRNWFLVMKGGSEEP